MSLRTHRMRFPLSREDALALHAGDQVVIDGEIVITAGVPTHARLLRCLDGAEPAPMDLGGAALFHLGSFSREAADGACELLYLNPTTSTRFNAYMPRLITGFRLCAVGGKGGLDDRAVEAMHATGCVYLSFLGGGCTPLTRAVRRVVQVGWTDMLIHYRLVRLEVEAMGPVTVGIDAHGRSLYAELQDQARQRLTSIIEDLDRARDTA